MAQNLMIDGTVFHGVNSISMTNENGEKVTYIEKTNAGTGVYVAEIGERQFYTVEDALKAAVSGETVKLISDCVENVNIVVSPGVTLDLNGKSLEADNVAALTTAHVIDSLDNYPNKKGGVLRVARNNLVLDPNNAQMPLWNGTDGYIFSTIAFSDNAAPVGLTLNAETGVATLKFVPWFDYVDENYVITDVANTGVEAMVRVTYEVLNDDGSVNGTVNQDYVFSDAQLQRVVQAAGSRALSMNVSGYSTKHNLTMTAMVISDTGVTIGGTKHTVTTAQ